MGDTQIKLCLLNTNKSIQMKVSLIRFSYTINVYQPPTVVKSTKILNWQFEVTCETFLTLCSSFDPLYPMGEGCAISNRSCSEKGFLNFLIINRQYS